MYRRNRRDLMITKEQPHVIDRPPPQLQQMRYEAPVQPPQIRPHRDQRPGHPVLLARYQLYSTALQSKI